MKLFFYYAFHSFEIYGFSFRIFAQKRNYLVNTDFYGFFNEKFKTVNIFRRCHAHSHIIIMRAETLRFRNNFAHAISFPDGNYFRRVQISVSVNHVDFVTNSFPQNLYAMAGFLFA